MDKQGLLLCAKYAVPPNFFGYCGPEENLSLVDHLKENVVDEELSHILSHFETLFPYLQLIARKNKILDPFDRRVVEAYWIGNQFLKPVTSLEYQAFAREKLLLDKKLKKEDLTNFFGKTASHVWGQFQFLNFKFYPHHNFHVFNIFRRTGRDSSFHTLKTMDKCRIGWGKIIKSSKLKIKNSSLKLKINSVIVETKVLTMNDNQLALSKSKVRELKVDYRGKSFLNNLKIGDWVSFHWGFVCDKLTKNQVKNLEFFTQKAIEFFNIRI